MDVMEKLVELIHKGARGHTFMPTETIANYLVEHGVTVQENCKACAEATQNCIVNLQEQIAELRSVQEWISVKDRLPTIYDADEDNCVLAIHKASKKRYYHWRSVAYNPFDFTHWMKTPQPPKGE